MTATISTTLTTIPSYCKVPFASMSITTNSTNTISLTGVGNDDFVADTGFIPVTGFEAGVTNDFTFEVGTNYIILPVDGYYKADGYASIYNTANANTVAVKFSFDGTVLSPRPVNARLPNSGDHGLLSGNGMFYATAGTVFGMTIAAEKTCVVTVANATIDVILLQTVTL